MFHYISFVSANVVVEWKLMNGRGEIYDSGETSKGIPVTKGIKLWSDVNPTLIDFPAVLNGSWHYPIPWVSRI